MEKDTTTDALFALVKAGLWEQDVRLAPFKGIDFNQVYQLAEVQSVIGVVAAGFDHVVDVKLPKEEVLPFVGQTLQLEQQNYAMNAFIGKIVGKMRAAGINALLVKGQGVAQCYERPLWRSCGDVDLLLSLENYDKAKSFLSPSASSIEAEDQYKKHLGMTIDSWVVELHGTLHTGLSARIDRAIDDIQALVHSQGQVRTWQNGDTQVLLPSPDNDVIFVFTHFLKHFYKEGLGLRQVCDWCRLLWTYRDSLNLELLESRIRKMGLMSEWKAFGMFAVDYLGMPAEAMPLYSPEKKWVRKADRICDFIMKVGNMGHNRESCYHDRPYLIRKYKSFCRRCRDLVNHAGIFPIDSLRFFPNIVYYGLRSAFNGEG